jgi:hypothetical protein
MPAKKRRAAPSDNYGKARRKPLQRSEFHRSVTDFTLIFNGIQVGTDLAPFTQVFLPGVRSDNMIWTIPRQSRLPLIATTAVMLGFIGPAAADIIYDEQIFVTAEGFGAAPRILTVQATDGGTESGCGANVGGSLATGPSACLATDASISGNGVVNTGGNESTGGDNKFDIVQLADVGVTTADEIAILYNPSQQGGNPATNIVDVTLKFYDADNNLVASVDNAATLTFTGDNPGNGGAGFVLRLDDAQAAAIDAMFGGDLSTATVALETTITNANDGPDSFRLTSIDGASTVPEPATIALFGSALLALGLVGGRRRRNV